MTRSANMIEAAAIAFRAACNGQGNVHHGRKYDCRVNFDKQRVEVTDEIGTENIDMLNADLNDKIRQLGKA